MRFRLQSFLVHMVIAIFCAMISRGFASSAQFSKDDLSAAQLMLRQISNEVKKHYYDSAFHGQDWDARVAEAKQGIESAHSWSVALSNIAAMLDFLDDSHTFFLPPERASRIEYGLRYQILGNTCVVTHVLGGSDAAAKGVKEGDSLLAINGVIPNRETTWRLQYLFGLLRPQQVLHLKLQDPGGRAYEVDVAAKVTQLNLLQLTPWALAMEQLQDMTRREAVYQQIGDRVIVIKLPEFFYGIGEVQDLIEKARRYDSLILDLRDDPGGSAETLGYMIGGLFDHEVKIADRVGRKETRPWTAKPLHHVYQGKVIVLVDSSSASAAELLARVIQIERRGIVIGDRTSGSVMEAKHYDYQIGAGDLNAGSTVIYYGASITDANLIMTDGRSLERTGVQPDELLIPSASAIAGRRDPLLAHAAAEMGVNLTSEEAGKLFPYQWPDR